MDDKLRTPTNTPDPLDANRPLQPFPQTAYQQVQRSEPVDTPATLPHIGGLPPMSQPPKSKGKAVLMILLTLLMLGAVAAAGFFYMQTADAQKQAEAARAEAANAKSEAEKLKKDVEEAREIDEAEAIVADKDAITGEVTARLHAITKNKAEKLKITVVKQSDAFAHVSAGLESGGGSAYILKKVDDQWVIVFSGQDKPPQDTIDAYSIPADYQSGQ